MGASGPPNTRTSATACVYGLQLRGSLFGQVHIPTGVDRWNLGTSPPAGLRTLTVVAQEQKAVLAKLFNHSEKQGGTQVGFKRMGPHAANAQGKPLGWIKCGLGERRFSSQRIQSSIIEIAGA